MLFVLLRTHPISTNMAVLGWQLRNSVRSKRIFATGFLLLSLICLSIGADSFFNNDKEYCEDDVCQSMEEDQSESRKTDALPRTSDVHKKTQPEEINVIITFTNAVRNMNLQKKFTLTVASLLKYTSIPLALHVIGENESQDLAAKIIKENAPEKCEYRFVKLDIDYLAHEMQEIIAPMQHHFSYKPGANYNHVLFFVSIALHQVMPEMMRRVIMLDADLKFKADIKDLYDHFELFTADNIIGIGRDLQPVYRHVLYQYRRLNPGTRVGDPPPNGLTGFNSGVLLLDLDKMRRSELYNSLINGESVGNLTQEFQFKGHLGDQDFYSLISMKYEQLFHVLPCQWNRQLCQWWKDKGYQSVFDLYYECPGPIHIYHGNCNTPIPDDD